MSTTRYSPDNSSLLSSESAYGAFNLGLHVQDDAKQVLTNRALLASLFPKNTDIQWLEQVHGSHVVCIDSHSSTAIKADAVYTKQTNIALAIMTADCLPILMTNRFGSEVAAIHGGWRPLVKGIIANTIEKFSEKSSLYAWLGPCIGDKKFEVGVDVYTSFIQIDSAFKQAFHQTSEHKYLANLHTIAKLQLKALGVENIYIDEHCTFSKNDQFYSYRRDKVTGRMASVISIK